MAYAALTHLKRKEAGTFSDKYESVVKAFCGFCKTDRDFNYVGYDLGIFPQKMVELKGLPTLLAEYEDKIVLYDCSGCNSSITLGRLKVN
ncbi:hypothetical protein J4449_02770 [Candidatus Woesearchaeota archaeon]|nr:hypothetical protein [Candidatus Woesearchaeota archaeon]